MARLVTLAFEHRDDLPSSAAEAQQGEIVTTLPGVYWRIDNREVRAKEIRLLLWPVNGHDADPLNGRAPRELPMRLARVVQPDFMPRPVA